MEHRIGDRRIIRLIQKWLKAGVLEGDQWIETTEGTPQGAVATPRTQKVTSIAHPEFAVRQWWRAARRRRWWLDRDRVPDRDGVVVDQDFLDEEADDFLSLGDLKGSADWRSRWRNAVRVSASRRNDIRSVT
ncbi:MAG: hypothetical protein J2P54_16690 [Bradyrhizobiaceae bacterium]|nr:hypothetical protein [Bradyrhizobiaceae bacterium]